MADDVIPEDTVRAVARIGNVILWQNGMVMVFDREGQQMPTFQGPETDALAKMRAAGWNGEPDRRVWPDWITSRDRSAPRR